MVVVIGGGVSGLAVGIASGGLVLEAADDPGGLCCSYYVASDGSAHSPVAPVDGDAFRFERGGGHWIFGGEPAVIRQLDAWAPMVRYERRAAIHFHDRDALVPYPLQEHVDHFGSEFARRVAREAAGRLDGDPSTMRDWLMARFGPTLCDAFFYPFHERYTAGAYAHVAPQDSYKSPPTGRGYNATVAYPRAGLGELARQMAARANVRFGAGVVGIDTDAKELALADGATVPYDTLVSTIPLHETVALADARVDAEPDPYTSAMVWNIGASRGPKCPDDHWVYLPTSASGAHRVGFYSNVDESFLPVSARGRGDRVAAYVEHAYAGGEPPSAAALAHDRAAMLDELQALGWIGDVEVVDPTWIDVAYTWSRPGSNWVESARSALAERGVRTVGRYATWRFQGIADSVRDGLVAGAELAR